MTQPRFAKPRMDHLKDELLSLNMGETHAAFEHLESENEALKQRPPSAVSQAVNLNWSEVDPNPKLHRASMSFYEI